MYAIRSYYGPLAVAEQAALDAIGPGHQPEFGRRHSRAAIIVRVQTDQDAAATREMPMHPLDLVGIDIGRRHLHLV